MTRGSAKRRALTRPASTAENSDGHWLITSPSRSTFHQLPDAARLTCTAQAGLRSTASPPGFEGTSVNGIDEAEPLPRARLFGPDRRAADPDVVVQHALPDEICLQREVGEAQLERRRNGLIRRPD